VTDYILCTLIACYLLIDIKIALHWAVSC